MTNEFACLQTRPVAKHDISVRKHLLLKWYTSHFHSQFCSISINNLNVIISLYLMSSNIGA